MTILITGICGFAGSSIAFALCEHLPGLKIIGIDNFIRPGSEQNRKPLRAAGMSLFHGDIRQPSDLETLPRADWVIDAAANPSVLAGVDGTTSSRQLVEHNLVGTLNLLEYCKAHGAGLTLLSTSRVYSIPPLASLPVIVKDGAFTPDPGSNLPQGVGPSGVSESFSTASPVSLYGATKLASECLALEYGETFGFPVFINRCGVMAGAGQFGRADQGIFSYWINSHLRRKSLRYIGFDGKGHQVRDCLHPEDLASLLALQIGSTHRLDAGERVINCSGGADSAVSLRQLTAWCDDRFGHHDVGAAPDPRPFDIPWMVLDSSKASTLWNWQATTPVWSICEQIAAHAQAHPDWLETSAPI